MALSPAEQRLAGIHRDNGRLAMAERGVSYAEREQDLRDREGAVFSRARQRAIDSRAGFIARNPNAVSPFERQAILGRAQQIEDRSNLQAHEYSMLAKQGENAIGVEREKAEGLKNQGSVAAQLNKDAQIETAKINGQNAVNLANAQGTNNLTLAEKQLAAEQANHAATLASNEKLAGITAETSKYQTDKTLEGTKLQAGVQEKVGLAQADATVLSSVNSATERQNLARQRQMMRINNDISQGKYPGMNQKTWAKMSAADRLKWAQEQGLIQ